MESRISPVFASVILVCLISSTQSQVFIPDGAAQVATPVVQDLNLVTQTVYGFLDFTTTIGNTVMVFSPQSSSAPLTEKPKDVSSNVIVDNAPPLANNEVINIQPSKTQISKKTEISQKVASIVQVNPAPKLVSSKVEIKSSPISQVNAIQSKPVQKAPIIISKVEVIEETKPSAVHQNVVTKVDVVTKAAKSIIASKVEVITEEKPTRSVVQVKSDEEDQPAVIIGNNIGEPEYDFLSRQPSEVVEETYKVINLRPSSKFQLKPRATAEPKNKKNDPQPTGLVSKMEGMVVHDGIMTSYETSVIGTFINGKYAQVLQSTSHVYGSPKDKTSPKAKIAPSQSLRILKTAAPTLKSNKKQQHLEPTPAASINEDVSIAAGDAFSAQNSIKTTRKPGKRFKNRQKEPESVEQKPEKDATAVTATSQSYKKSSSKNRNQSRNSNEESIAVPTGKRFSGSGANRRKAASRTTASSSEEKNNSGFSRRGYKPKIQTSTVEQGGDGASTSLYKFKLNRTPGRWQYKTTPRPRVSIRKQPEDEESNTNSTSEHAEKLLSGKPEGSGNNNHQQQQQQNNEVATPQARSDDVDSLEGSESIATIIDDDSATENKLDSPQLPLETLKVEISTPPDFKDIYYEIATIKSPYTFQAGNVKNTRYITVTSTFEKSLEKDPEPTPTLSPTEPLTENILATTNNYAKDNNLDSSIATLPPIYLASDVATPPLETLTETFSTTQTMLKTHILPVIRGVNDTTISTLVQTYLITRVVTATKTLPPMEAYHFNPSKTLNEFNSRLDEAGSELHLELEFGDSNEQDEDGIPRRAVLPADLDLANIGTDFKLPETDKAKIEKELKNRRVQKKPDLGLSQEQLQQLALLRLLNPAAAQGQVITTSKPVIKVETLYETHVLPVTQGHNTILSTISKVKGTFTKTDYEFGTSTIPPAFQPPIPQYPQLPQIPQIPQLPQFPQQPPVNPLFPPQPQFTITSSPVTQSTIITQTNSKVLKLTFGAKTAHTTVFSTTVIPTVLTTYMTASVPVVAPTAAYPGYFPQPYPPPYNPYVG
ncbi:uncharacterized protein LOC126737935 isoform X2 [Anthonomus grandis grandis]|uniref:uncharacterized protein LOC126737935 isoform X2 n=1 Tax=Anthonomus grandis grandis TaxID=2921223 RepID=UPI00216515B8|nr:uncharacterized protein LOC126737935 isoform X2 [Anthonomus grandis grandis]